jgi:hypothetical protein
VCIRADVASCLGADVASCLGADVASCLIECGSEWRCWVCFDQGTWVAPARSWVQIPQGKCRAIRASWLVPSTELPPNPPCLQIHHAAGPTSWHCWRRCCCWSPRPASAQLTPSRCGSRVWAGGSWCGPIGPVDHAHPNPKQCIAANGACLVSWRALSPSLQGQVGWGRPPRLPALRACITLESMKAFHKEAFVSYNCRHNC